jgi:hypothetical protein
MELPVRLVSPSADGFAENIFLVGIDIPMAALGLGGLWSSIQTGKW